MNSLASGMTEIFSSVQGEGLLVGLRQVFLRFNACNLGCEYCDTTRNSDPEFCLVEGTPGRRDFLQVRNPVPLEQVIALLDLWQKGWPDIHHSISLTGGEPLLYLDTLKKWLPALRERLPIYLETNGVLSNALATLIGEFDYISMDIKLPSTSGHADLWKNHHEFLKVAVRAKVTVKTVIGDATEDWEIRKACDLIASIDRNIPYVLQPVTLSTGKPGIAPFKTLEFQEIAASCLSEVRIIPQTHKFLGQL